MRKVHISLLLIFSLLIMFGCRGSGSVSTPVSVGQGELYYARCNLKVIKGSYITWINWQSTPTFVPVNTELRVLHSGDEATLTNVKTGSTYTLEIGAAGETFLEKFLSRYPVDLSRFSQEVQNNIQNTLARVGMTKEEVYIAMGPPTQIPAGRTNMMSYEAIMGSDLWIYARRRFGKNIGVAFDPTTGKVNRTEGIWR